MEEQLSATTASPCSILDIDDVQSREFSSTLSTLSHAEAVGI